VGIDHHWMLNGQAQHPDSFLSDSLLLMMIELILFWRSCVIALVRSWASAPD
jgi:hypothetical protein